ncbi:hypothetical protein IFT56_20150 [Rhizobium sp. CFBP 13717]|nr:hypothetical protein [Rhizobium sp. CFBP 13644]MBD8693912.1 hypothetical protein [Rhizobium sp. CFBP 13717]
MLSLKLRSVFRWASLSVALGVVVLHAPSEAAAQVVAGHSIGEDRGKLDGVAWQNSFGGYVDGKFMAANGVEVSATSEQSTGKLVRLEAKWDGKGLRQLAYFSDFRFGQTTLADIKKRFGNLGLLPAGGSSVSSTPDGGVTISNFYEVSGSKTIATFVTNIGRRELLGLKRRHGADAYAHMETVATLHSMAISDAVYFKNLRGATSIADIGYSPIAWTPMSSSTDKPKRKMVLSRIKYTQLPVARVYSGPRNPPDLSGQNSTVRSYQDRIAMRMAEGPAFAGEYAVIQIDCGARCSNAYVGNVRTGEVFKLPVGGRNNLDLSLKYELSSRLMTAQWSDAGSGECAIQFFSFDDGEWIELLKHEIGDSKGCSTSLSYNLR